MTKISAPIFLFGDSHQLPDIDPHLREHPEPSGTYALAGPSAPYEAGRLPLRGDLAHIKLAGRYFVPHYAVPVLYRATANTSLLKAGNAQAEIIAELQAGDEVEVLDIAGNWAWGQLVGQAGEEGLVGYISTAHLEKVLP